MIDIAGDSATDSFAIETCASAGPSYHFDGEG